MASASDQSGPIFFYSTSPPWGFLSQWYKSPFTAGEEGQRYEHAEQLMMHQKAVLFGDTATAEKILQETSPKKIKQYGREAVGFVEEVWLEKRKAIVADRCYHRFAHSLLKTKDLKALLLSTGERELVEASADRTWGIGYSKGKAMANTENWGLNLLGKSLAAARTRIRLEAAT